MESNGFEIGAAFGVESGLGVAVLVVVLAAAAATASLWLSLSLSLYAVVAAQGGSLRLASISRARRGGKMDQAGGIVCVRSSGLLVVLHGCLSLARTAQGGAQQPTRIIRYIYSTAL
jgi:hypothetical protein